MSATMTDNRKWQCGQQNQKYTSGTMTDRMTVPTANMGFSTTPGTLGVNPSEFLDELFILKTKALV